MIHVERKLTREYTVVKCTKCGATEQRKFSAGDIVFSVSGKCAASCGGTVRIEKIFGETVFY